MTQGVVCAMTTSQNRSYLLAVSVSTARLAIKTPPKAETDLLPRHRYRLVPSTRVANPQALLCLRMAKGIVCYKFFHKTYGSIDV